MIITRAASWSVFDRGVSCSKRYLKAVSSTLQSRPHTTPFLAIAKEGFVWCEVCDGCRSWDCCSEGTSSHSCQGVWENYDTEMAGTNAGMHNQLWKIFWKGVCRQKCHWHWLELISKKFFSEHIFLQGLPPNTFHINQSSSEPIYTTDFVLVLFGRYWRLDTTIGSLVSRL